jgi:hypothetical protein
MCMSIGMPMFVSAYDNGLVPDNILSVRQCFLKFMAAYEKYIASCLIIVSFSMGLGLDMIWRYDDIDNSHLSSRPNV